MLFKRMRWSYTGLAPICRPRPSFKLLRSAARGLTARRNYASAEANNERDEDAVAEEEKEGNKNQQHLMPPFRDHVHLGGVVALDDVSQVTPGDLLAKMSTHTAYPHPFKIPSHNKLFTTFLFTKSFANVATDENFIRDAITKVLRGIRNPSRPSSLPPLQIDLLVACVDAIPMPGPTYMKRSGYSNRRTFLLNAGKYRRQAKIADAAKAAPVYDQGHEGFAYCVTAHEQQVPFETVEDEVPAENAPRNTKNMTPDTQGTLSFVIRDLNSASPASQRIKIPLAKTIFNNGSPHTMHSSSWIENNATARFELMSQQAHQHAAVTVPLEASAEDRPMIKRSWHVATPLIPLTPPREVTASMGNIVRQIGGEDVPASHELETAVVQFFEQNDMPVQAAAVWALVIPRETAAKLEAEGALDLMHADKEFQRQQTLFRRRSEIRRDLFSSIPYQLMLRGARLHKVLSGGGGWGKKAGLLSLDPESDYSSIDPTSPGRNLDLDGLINEPAPVTEVASPDDYIRFYICPNLPAAAFPDPPFDSRKNNRARIQQLEFGVLPSTMDDMDPSPRNPATSAEDSETPASRLKHYTRQFGALSEGGMSLEVTNDAGAQTTLSKVDVPYSRFSYQYYTYAYSLEKAREEAIERARLQALAKEAAQQNSGNLSTVKKSEDNKRVKIRKLGTNDSVGAGWVYNVNASRKAEAMRLYLKRSREGPPREGDVTFRRIWTPDGKTEGR